MEMLYFLCGCVTGAIAALFFLAVILAWMVITKG